MTKNNPNALSPTVVLVRWFLIALITILTVILVVTLIPRFVREGAFVFWTRQSEPVKLMLNTERRSTCNFGEFEYQLPLLGKVVECVRTESDPKVYGHKVIYYYARLEDGSTWVWVYDPLRYFNFN